MKIFKCFLILVALLSDCSPAAPVTPSATSQAINTPASSTQPPAPTFTPLPSQTFTPAPSQTLIPTAKPTQTSAPTSTISPEANLILERVAQLGGSINGITIVSDVAYIGMGPRVAAIDIRQHESPRLIGQSQPLPGLVSQLLTIHTASNNRLLVNAGKFLILIDTSNPNALELLNQLELPGAITAMVLDEGNGILYAGGIVYQAPYEYLNFIASIDISSEEGLNLLDKVAFPEQPISLAFTEGSLFIGTDSYTCGLYRIALETPGVLSAPHLVIASSTDNYYAPYSMQVIGDRFYIGNYNTLEAYDITDPDQPSQVWATSPTSLMVKSFSVTGDQIDIFGWSPAGSYLPGQNVITAPQSTTGAPVGKVASLTTFHQADFIIAYHDLEIYDSKTLELVGSYQSPVTSVLGAAINNHAVYVVDGGVGDGRNPVILRVFSLPELEPLGQVKTDLESSCCPFTGIAIEGDRAYLAALDSLWVYDISSNTPTLLAKPTIVGGQLDSIAVKQLNSQQLLVTGQQEASMLNVLTVYNVTDLQKLVPIGNPLYLDLGRIYQMTWDGSSLYIILGAVTEGASDQLYVVSFLNNALAVQGKLSLPGSVYSLAAHNGMVTLTGTAGLLIVSVSDPQSPRLLGKVALPDIGGHVGLIGDGVVVTAGGTGGFASAALVELFDLKSPTNPLKIQALDIAYENVLLGPMSVSAPYIILTGSSGIEVLEYQFRK